MIVLFAALLLFAGPFWTAKPPSEWSDQEIAQLMSDSPWAQTVAGPGRSGGSAAVQVYIATAGPIRQAEKEMSRRAELRRKPGVEPVDDPLAREYRDWLEDNRTSQIILAIRVGRQDAFSNEAEVTRMEKESVMRIGRKKVQMTGHFPPYSGDPYLRLAFPRQSGLSGKLSFELYLPGVPAPYRTVDFDLKDMVVGGKPEL